MWKRFALLPAVLAVSLLAAASPALAEPQPDMQAALVNLRQARAALERASNDKGSYKVQAMRLVDQAIEAVQSGIQYDNQHKNDRK